MIQFIMERLLKIFNENGGYATNERTPKKWTYQTRTIADAVSKNIIEKVKPGLYKLIDYPWDEHGSFADVCNSNMNAVICLTISSRVL